MVYLIGFRSILNKAILPALLLCAFSIVHAQVYRNLTLTEIGFNTPPGNNEYVEVFNLSYTETLDLYNVRIKYGGVYTDTVVPTGMNALLPPRTYAVIFEGDYDFVNGMYKNIVPPGAVVVKLHGATFGSTGMSNTSDKAITLISPYGDSLETYTYTTNNAEGYSDEKKVLSNNNTADNWGNCRRYAGTPGGINTLLARQKNLALGSVSVQPPVILPATRVTLKIVVFNYGTANSGTANILVYNDRNFDSAGTPDEQIADISLAGIAAGDSVKVNQDAGLFPAGITQLCLKIIYAGDEDTVDNKGSVRFTVYRVTTSPGDVVINEFMPNPGTKGNEWVELYNRTNEDISLRKWTIHDRVSSSVISTNNLVLGAKKYLILSRDSTFRRFYPFSSQIQIMNLPILNNDEDVIGINDSLGIPVDSVEYILTQAPAGVSREKINPDALFVPGSANWAPGSYPYFATPGDINSATPKMRDAAITQFSLHPFPVTINQTLTAAVTVKNIGKTPLQDFFLVFYNDENKDSIPQQNEFITQINLDPLDTGRALSFTTELFDVRTSEVRILCRLLPEDDYKINNSAYGIATPISRVIPLNALVINEIQAEPKTPYPEWVEIFNTTTEPIDLKGLRFCDANDTIRISTKTFLLGGKEYAVLTRDSSMSRLYKGIKNLILCSLPQLNNDGDSLRLLDSLGFPVDNVPYKNIWGARQNYSLEKITETAAGSTPGNWRSSECRWYGTPGYINSITEKTRDAYIKMAELSPVLPARGDTVSIRLLIGCTQSVNLQVNFYEDLDSNGTPDTRLALFTAGIGTGNIPAYFTVPYKIKGLSNTRYFYASITYTGDQDTANDNIFLSVIPGYRAGTITITEIMASPLAGRPEWLELINTTNDTINLSGWSISDVLSVPATVGLPPGTVCPPMKRIILTTDSIQAFYPMQGVPQYLVNLPPLNNDADGVVLHDNRGLTLDSVFYSFTSTYENGKSLEKFNISLPGTATYNWDFSRDRRGATPGRINSVEPKRIDVSIVSVLSIPQYPTVEDTAKVQVTFRNDGTLQSLAGEGVFRILPDKETVFQIPALNRNSVYSAEIPVVFTDSVLAWDVQSTFPDDEDPLNNNAAGTLTAGQRQGSVIINEIVPVSDMLHQYWFELFNTSGPAINLQNWAVSFSRSGTLVSLSNKPLILQPGEYRVFSPDTLLYVSYGGEPFPVGYIAPHNGYISTMYLTDSRGALQDSFYSPAVPALLNRSWERSRFNGYSFWSAPLNGYTASPGKMNTVNRAVLPKRGSLIINEIMYQPLAGKPEYAELYNPGSTAVDLPLVVFEKEGMAAAPLQSVAGKIGPGSFCILTADSLFRQKYPATPVETEVIVFPGFSGFRSDNQSLVLRNIGGAVTDSIRYSSSFHNKKYSSVIGRSLERISSLGGTGKENWSSNVNASGNTAGYGNSISLTGSATGGRLSFSPNPFSPDDDGFEDFCAIRYSLPASAAALNLTLYDDRGRMLRRLITDTPAPATGEYIFNGKDNGNTALPVGQYILYLEAIGLDGAVLAKEKGVVVITKGR